MASEADPSVRFAVIGDGELRAELTQTANQFGLEGTVYFAGWRKDLAPIYADMDLVVLSSKNEGTPVSIIEAAAAGKPVVSTLVGGVPDMITDGWNGLLVPAENPQALANAILRIRRDPHMAEDFVSRSRSRIVEKYDIKNLLSNLETLYFRLLRRKGINV
jgi:glycosyltransferase involved in cell wall biosynthesis